MSDQKRKLQETLEQLNAELKRTQTADETQRQQLHALQSNVQSLLERSGEAPWAHDQSVVPGLRASLQHFEATHPVVTSLIEQVVNTLTNMGI
jgi:predicted ribosome quality control (RQC) complex YloA/Tae2 family protein